MSQIRGHRPLRSRPSSDDEEDLTHMVTGVKVAKSPQSSPSKRSPGKIPSGRSPGKIPSGRSPGKKSPARKSPARRKSSGKSPGRRSPGKKSPGKKSPRKKPLSTVILDIKSVKEGQLCPAHHFRNINMLDLDSLDSEAISVATRLRPAREKPNQPYRSLCVEPTMIEKNEYDVVFGEESEQREIYEHFGNKILAEFILNQRNCCLMAYGQTSSGKTHTITGTNWETPTQQRDRLLSESQTQRMSIENLFRWYRPMFAIMPVEVIAIIHKYYGYHGEYGRLRCNENIGFIPRLSRDILPLLAQHDPSIELYVTYVEIYNEKVRDLLQRTREFSDSIKVRYVNDFVELEGAEMIRVTNYAQLIYLITHGHKARAQKPTKMNLESSRSHAIVTLYQKRKGKLLSKLMVVDLAGSERVGKQAKTKEELKEGIAINTSLLNLGMLVSKRKASKKKSIPAHSFRGSLINELLRDMLNKNSRFQLLGCLNIDAQFGIESRRTLEFLSSAINKKQKAKVTVLDTLGLGKQQASELNRVLARMERNVRRGIITDSLNHILIRRVDEIIHKIEHITIHNDDTDYKLEKLHLSQSLCRYIRLISSYLDDIYDQLIVGNQVRDYKKSFKKWNPHIKSFLWFDRFRIESSYDVDVSIDTLRLKKGANPKKVPIMKLHASGAAYEKWLKNAKKRRAAYWNGRGLKG